MAIARETGSVSGLGPMLKQFRQARVLGQIQFAQILGVDQGSLAKWEKGIRPMPVSAILKMVELAQTIEEKDDWLQHAGISLQDSADDPSPRMARQVPLLKNAASLGTAEAQREEGIERIWSIPKDWLPKRGEIYAVKVDDESMSPILEPGFVVVVDVSKRDEKLLVNKMVVTKDEEGVKLRWLRRDLGMYLLIPQDLQRHPISGLSTQRGQGIVGEVVMWTGWPRTKTKGM